MFVDPSETGQVSITIDASTTDPDCPAINYSINSELNYNFVSIDSITGTLIVDAHYTHPETLYGIKVDAQLAWNDGSLSEFKPQLHLSFCKGLCEDQIDTGLPTVVELTYDINESLEFSIGRSFIHVTHDTLVYSCFQTYPSNSIDLCT